MVDDHKPQILAPAGDEASFLAALAAGADAVYAALKHFSARMEASNFSVAELARLRELAAKKGARLFIPMNVMTKERDLESAARLLDRVNRVVAPDALILQDLGLARLARQAGFTGRIHLSTLANVSVAADLPRLASQAGVSRVILPRELTIDEIKIMAEACPDNLELEIFVHGALCYGVSGRCYWSSYLGGKSGLRGRCVQPCRRLYSVRGRQGRYFSCRDLSLDVLAKVTREIPKVASWKIEGRKKGPHYVFYAVTAYRMLRDEGDDPQAKKAALDILDQALGRPGTHYHFLPQRPHPAVGGGAQTGSGRLAGITAPGKGGRFGIRPREALLAGDLLRVGYEDEPGHRVVRVTRSVPKGGRIDVPAGKAGVPKPKTPVFLIDRREPELTKLLADLGQELKAIPMPQAPASSLAPKAPTPWAKKTSPWRVDVYRDFPKGRLASTPGVWVRPGIVDSVPKTMRSRTQWWLPPVTWPSREESWKRTVGEIVKGGGRFFVLNAPWQISFFVSPAKLKLWAGPFTNMANTQALAELRDWGFAGALVSPELPGKEILELPAKSPLPLGLVVGGLWPLCVSRTYAAEMKTEEPFESPMGEVAWARKYGEDYWVYPGWPLDLSRHLGEITSAGYSMLVNLSEPKPRAVPQAKRASEFNWNLKLL